MPEVRWVGLVCLCLVVFIAGCTEVETPEVTPTPTQQPTSQTPLPTLSATQTPTPTPTEHPTESPEIISTTATTTPTPSVTSFDLQYGEKYKVEVVEVIDGDTIDVILPDNTEERVRMLGVDTPETSASNNEVNEYDDISDLNCLETWGVKAKQYATTSLEGETAYIEFDSIAGIRGYYGRLLAYVYHDNTDFTAELVKQGYARVYDEGDCKKESEYLSYQESAITSNSGLWACRTEPTSAPSTNGGIKVWQVHEDASGRENDNLNDEYVILKNTGSTSINLQDWYIEDEANHRYTFPDFTLETDATVTIHTGSGSDTSTDLYWGSEAPVWNNGGDTAYLYDKTGDLVDENSW